MQKRFVIKKNLYGYVTNIREICTIYQVVKNWSRQFKLGKTTCKHALGAGRPKTVVTQENVHCVLDTVLKDSQRDKMGTLYSCNFWLFGGSRRNELVLSFGFEKCSGKVGSNNVDDKLKMSSFSDFS